MKSARMTNDPACGNEDELVVAGVCDPGVTGVEDENENGNEQEDDIL